MTAPAAAGVISEADAETLDTLALRTPPADGIPFIAGALSWPGFTARQLDEAWEAFQDAVLWHHLLNKGTCHWIERFDEADLPRGDGCMDAAIELARRVMDEARDHLVFGGPR